MSERKIISYENLKCFNDKIQSQLSSKVTYDEFYNLAFTDIKNTPIQDDSSEEFNIVDTNGNIAFKVTSDAVYAKDFVTGTVSLSNLISRITALETQVRELQNTIQTLTQNS